MAKKKKDSILDNIVSAFTGNKKTSSSKKSSSSNKTYKTLNQREAERGQSEAKKAQQKSAQTKKANNNRKNSNTKYKTLNQREASRGQSVANSYKNRTTSTKSSTTANKAAYDRYRTAHSNRSSGNSFLSENANKSRTEVSRRTKDARRTTNRYAQNNQTTKNTTNKNLNKTLNQQEAERGMGVVNRYQQKSDEIAKQNKQRAEEYKNTNSKLKEEQTNEHKSLLTGAKNTDQQEAMRGLSESKKTEKSMEIADRERKNQKSELEKAVTERKNKIESDTKSIKETQQSRRENTAKFNGTTSTQREIEDAQKTKQYQEDKYGKDNANRILSEQNKREGKMSDLSEASPMSLARRGNKKFAEKQDKVQENKDLKAIKDTTTGTVKQVAGGYLKTLGDMTAKADTFEQTRFLDAQTQKKNISEEQKETYKGLRNEINTQTDFTKEGGYYNPVYDTGKKLQTSGDQEVNDALESTKGNKLKNLGLQTYSAIIGNTADRMFGPLWAVSMASRTYGNTIDTTQAQGATKDEDRMNALLQATKEVATEYLFSGFGAAAKLTGTGALFEKSALGKLKNSALDNVANKVGERFGNVAKNIAYSGGKMFLGGTEEAAEELIGGVLDAPISNFSYANAVDKRTEKSYREQLMGSSTDILDRISNESATTGIDEAELRKLYGEQINSADFIDDQSEYFIDAGMDEKSAEKLAENMQKYLSASLSGDKETAQKYEDVLASDYMKSASVKQKFSVSDTLEAMTVAYMMTAVTGASGTVANQYHGAQVKAYQGATLDTETLGTAVQKMANRKFGATNSAQAICNVAMNTEDSKVQARVQAMRDVANNGGELALEQYSELQGIINEQQTKNYESIQTANNLSMRNASEQGYAIGAQKMKNGTATVLEGDHSYNNAVKVANDLNKTFDSDRQLDETQIGDVARAVANTQLGNLNVEDIACLSSNMIEERAIYEKATGETLPMVLNDDGTINSAETNKATREYLVSKSADNFVTWAKKETERYASETKGKYESKYMNNMGYVGQNVLSSISEKADALSEADYNAQMRQMQRVYEAGKNGTDLTAIKKDIVENYGFDGEDVERMYQAGKMDSDGSGYSVRIEKSGADTNEYSMRDTHENRKALKAIADSFGVNIVVTDNIKGNSDAENSVDNGVVNGYFDYDTNTMYLNNANATRNIGYTLMHELTHNLSQYNTEAFNELVGTFSEMWKERNPEAYKKWTDAVRDRYSQFGTELTEDQIMEEILCDQMGEILHDEDFMNDLVDEHRSVAELFLDIIKQAIRKLREMFGLGDVFDSRFEEATLSEYNLLKDAEKFLTDALREKKMLDALDGKRVAGKRDSDYSIAETTDGRKAVLVNQKIFDASSSRSDIYKELKKIFKSLGTVRVYGQDIGVNGKTANEVVNSKDSSNLKRSQGVVAHTDKMNVATKPDEVLEASEGYVGEAKKHKRKDSIAEFARGKVLVSVDGRAYTAEVITGTYPNGYCMLYDVINFTPENISIKKIIKPSLGIESPISGEGLWLEDGFVGNNIQDNKDSVNEKSGTDYSLDISTDTENESEYREWDLPEAVENQLLADLESSFVEESEGDVYVDGEAKSYVNVSLESRKGVKANSILDLKGKDLRDAIQDWFRKYEDGFERTAYLDPKSVSEEDFGDGTVTGRVTFTGNWDKAKNWFGNATVYLRDKNTGVNIALPVAVVEMNYGGYTLFARAMGDVDVGYHKGDHSLDVLGYPKIVHADEDYRLYNDNYLSSGLQSELIAEGDIARGTSRPEGMEEYYPRVSPWVEQQGLDIKNELKDTAAGIVEKWKKDAKLTGGRVLDENKFKPIVNKLIDHAVPYPELFYRSERKVCREITMDALKSVWYEMHKETPDLDVVYEILEETADFVVNNSPALYTTSSETEENDDALSFFRRHNRSNPIVITRWVDDRGHWYNPIPASTPERDYRRLMKNSKPPGNRWENMRALKREIDGMFAVRYTKYGEKTNWESYLYDYLEDAHRPAEAESVFGGSNDFVRGIKSEEDFLEFLVREARERNAQLTSDGRYMDEWTSEFLEEATADFKKEFVADSLKALETEGVAWESVADKWKDKYDTMRNRLKAEHKAEVLKLKESKKAELKELRAKKNEEIRQVKAEKNAKIKEVRDLKNKKIKELRGNKNAKIEALKAKQKQKDQKRKENETRKKYTEKIGENYKWFTDRLQKKERALEKNIPEVLRQPLADALSVMDIQEKGSVKAEQRSIKKFGVPTKSAQALHVLHSTLETMAKKGELFSDVNQDIFSLNPVISDALEDLIESCEGKAVRDMTNEELMNVHKLMSAIRHEITEGNNVILDGRKLEISSVQKDILSETRKNITRRGKAKTYKDTNAGKNRELLHKIKSFDFVAPISFFKNIGGTLEQSFYDLVKESENDYIRFTHDDKEFAKKLTAPFRSRGKVLGTYKSKLRKWDSKTREFTLESGKKIELSAMQVMTMYCESKQKDAMDHMLKQGIYVDGADERSKFTKVKNKTNLLKTGVDRTQGKSIYVVTSGDIAEIISTLSKDQKEFADSLQEYMNTTLRRRGNNASMEMYGVELFNVQNYFPMDIRLENGEIKRLGMSSDVGNIPNPNFTSHRKQNAEGALAIGNVMRVFTDYANQVNVYASSLSRVKQFQKICGDNGIRRTLNEAYGNGAHEYIDQMIKDFIGQRQNANTSFTNILMRGMNTYKRAAISTNLSVLAQQGTAIFRAYMEIGPRYFYGRSVNKNGSASLLIKKLPLGSVYLKNDKLRNEMFKYCPIAEWKFMGNHQLNFSRSLEDIMMNNYTVRDFIAMGFYEKADLRCWLKIWQAVKREQRKLHPEMDTSSDEFLNLCGKRAEIIFGYTQTVDSPLHRPQVMRSGGAVEKAYSSFMAEPLKTYNIFRDSFVMANQNATEAKYLKKLKKASTDKAEIAELKKEIKGLKKQWHRNMARMLTVLTLNGVAAAFAKSLVQALRKLDTNADDDDDENDSYWKLFFEYWGENTSSNLNIIEQVPGGDLLMDVIDSIFETLSDPENASYTSILYKKTDILTDWLWNPVEELQTLAKNRSDDSATLDDYLDFILSLATLGGYGFANAKRDTAATAHALATLLGIDTSVFAGTEEDESSGKSKGGFVDKVSGAASGAKKGANSALEGAGNVVEKVLGFGGKQFTSDDGLLTKVLEKFGMKEGGAVDKWLDSHGLTMTDKEKKARERQKEIDGYLAKGKGKTGETKEKAIYSAITKDWKKSFEDGESLKSCYKNVDHMLDMMDACKLSDETKEKFIKNVTSNTKTMYKKEIGKETDESFKKMDEHIKWLTQNGWSAEDISSKIVMQSNTKREFQCALKMGDTDGAIKELTALYDAGLTDEDAYKAYKNYTRCTVDKTSKYWKETKATGTYAWPVRGTITSYYGNRTAPTAGASSNHQAIDIAVAEGTTVGASDGGTVTYAGTYGGYGYTVRVDHGNGVVTQYGHLSKIGVTVGQKVSKGQEIAKSGNTGTSTGPHLDFKMWINGSTVDPLKRLRS